MNTDLHNICYKTLQENFLRGAAAKQKKEEEKKKKRRNLNTLHFVIGD